MADKLRAWGLIVLSYLFTFGTPLLTAYLLLTDDEASNKPKMLFYLILGVVGIAFLVSLGRVMREHKANGFKALLRVLTKVVVIGGFLSVVNYIDFNVEVLKDVLYLTMGGFFLGWLFEMLAIHWYKDYIREVGVF